MRTGKLGIARLEGKGRGVVALEPCEPGEVLEVAPAIELSPADTDHIASTVLDHYYFANPGEPEGGLLVLGYASLMNHSNRPNAETVAHRDEAAGWTIRLHALQPIAKGEEVSRCYSCEPWFGTV